MTGHSIMKDRPILFMAALGFLMAGTLTEPVAAQPIEFKAGIADASNSVLAWWMAEAGGFFAQQGLKVELPAEGGNRGLEALQAGRLDVMHRGLSNIVRVNRAGGDLRLIGSLGDKIRFVFFSAPGVRTAADLKGGVIGISDLGSEADSAVMIALARLGLSRSDVTIREAGDSAHQLAAVKNGEIQATVLGEPFASLAREQGVNVLVDLAGEQIPWMFTGIAAQRSAIMSRRDPLKRFLRATIEGNYLAFTDAPRAKAILAKQMKINDPRIVEISYNDYKRQTPLNADLSPKAAENTIAQFPGGSSRLGDYIDPSLLDEIRQEGFISALQQKYRVQ
jgi:ABC-type nitrate/sulfonate/bicarbonate transport system substrate-binding protein